MTETVVHVETIEQWKSVLDVWFEQGYEWWFSGKDYREDYYDNGGRQIGLNVQGDNEISFWSRNDCDEDILIEYADFMAQQEKTMAKETYYVTQEQLDLINNLKETNWPLAALVNSKVMFIPLNNGLEMIEEKAILRYLGGDTSVEFKVKEQLYRLWRIGSDDERVYMRFNEAGTPSWAQIKENAFTAPLEEIEKWKTPAWEIEEAD